ncbi:centromere-associated protein E-like, partial [Limulus polyphemus]|uniref:Centromere-associated protein E-like n=1 Tax=Limulus polyphemus TaxID=6850 RepID=A0ABM1TR55_LIMPO
MSDCIHVAIRVRPLIQRENRENSNIQWDVKNKNAIFQIDKDGNCVQNVHYVFDRVFHMNETNMDIFQEICSPIIESVMQGFN